MNKKIFTIIIIISIIATGIFAFVDLWKTNGITSKVYGLLNIKNEEIEVNSFSLNIIGFQRVEALGGGNNYTFKQIFSTDLTDLSKYSVTINGNKCATISTRNSLNANYSLNFYNLNNELLVSDTLAINCALHFDSLEIALITQKSSAVGYWNEYFNANGFNVTLIEELFKAEEVDIESKPATVILNGNAITVNDNTLDVKIKLNALNFPTSYNITEDPSPFAYAQLYVNNELWAYVKVEGIYAGQFEIRTLIGYIIAKSSQNFNLSYMESVNTNLMYSETIYVLTDKDYGIEGYNFDYVENMFYLINNSEVKFNANIYWEISNNPIQS